MARWKPSEDQRNMAERLSVIGMTQQQIANCLGVSLSTWTDAIKKDESLRQLILKGAEAGNGKVHDTLFKMATSGEQPAATIFWMKVRSRWKQPALEIEHSGKDGEPIQTSHETPEEREARHKRVVEKLRKLNELHDT